MLLRLAAMLCLAPSLVFAACKGADLSGEIRAKTPEIWREAEAQAAGAAFGDGLLWKASKPGVAPSYIFGTYHTERAETFAPSRRALELAREARVVMVEITPGEKKAMEAAFAADPTIMLNAAPQPLTDWLTPALTETAAARLAPFGMNLETASLIQPWMLNLMIALPPCAVAALAAGAPQMDHQIADAGAAVVGLETWRSQIGVFTSPSVEQQRDAFRMALASPVDPEDMHATMSALYEAGAPMLIWELSVAMAKAEIADRDVDAVSEEMWRALVVERNRNMIAAALPEMEAGGAVVAVGALHLPTEDGLLALAQRAGFTIERLE